MKTTFKTFITESAEFDLDKFFVDCAPFLNAMKGTKHVPLRGLQSNDEPWLIKSVRSDRKPRDTPSHIHLGLKEFFVNRFGWDPRSQGMFLTGRARTAFLYGLTYVVFPMGKFEIIWSPDISDLTTHMTSFIEKAEWKIEKTVEFMHADGDTQDKLRREALEKAEKEAFESLEKSKWVSDNNSLVKALATPGEISVKCDRYYAFKENAVDSPGPGKLVLDALRERGFVV